MLVAVLTGAAVAVTLSRGSEDAAADPVPANTICKGHLAKGEPEADDPEATQVQYTFACSGPITGYQIQPDHAVQSMDTEIFATDRTTKEVVGTDALNCNGDIPGFGVNCVGIYGGQWRVVTGRFAIEGELCAEPRVDALLTVVIATKDARNTVSQAIAGPFELGRPRGCPRTKFSGKTRIPTSEDTPAEY